MVNQKVPRRPGAHYNLQDHFKEPYSHRMQERDWTYLDELRNPNVQRIEPASQIFENCSDLEELQSV
jgi:hypothetical protein